MSISSRVKLTLSGRTERQFRMKASHLHLLFHYLSLAMPFYSTSNFHFTVHVTNIHVKLVSTEQCVMD